MEEEEKKPTVDAEVFKSPNIHSADGEELDIAARQDGPETSAPTVDGVPIAEEDIKFRAENIKKHDDRELFVKIEGAEKRARQAQRDKKKQEDALIKRLHTAANERKKAHKKAKNEQKAAKRKATRQAIHHKVKKTAKHIYRFRFLILALIIIAIGFVVVKTVVIPAIEAQKVAEQKAAEDKAVEDGKTPMVKVFMATVGKDLSKDELEEIVESNVSDPGVFYQESTSEGLIDHRKGGTEAILFETYVKNGITYAHNFMFTNTVNEKSVHIYEIRENTYIYAYDGVPEEIEGLDATMRRYVLMASGKED